MITDSETPTVSATIAQSGVTTDRTTADLVKTVLPVSERETTIDSNTIQSDLTVDRETTTVLYCYYTIRCDARKWDHTRLYFNYSTRVDVRR